MDDIRIGLIGIGNIMGRHARGLLGKPEARIVALCDVKKDTCKQFADRLSYERGVDLSTASIFDDTASLYQETKVDAVIIATPHTLHFEHCMQALQEGCHVLVEKPMVTRADDAYRLKERVDQSGKALLIGYNSPYTPEFSHLRQIIRRETLGKLELVNGFLSQSWRQPTRGSWRQELALSGGGQAYDSGAHLLNSLCWAVEARVVEVFAFIDNMDCPVDVNSAINVRFDNGVMGNVAIGGNCPAGGSHMVFMFENGRVDIDGWVGNWINIFDGDQQVKYPQITGHSMDPIDNFIDVILGRDEPRTTVENGVAQSELMDAIYESARTGGIARIGGGASKLG